MRLLWRLAHGWSLLAFGLFSFAPVGVAQTASPSSPLNSQTAGRTSHVLDLDGSGSYVELPTHIFDNLSNATVEAWVNWDLPAKGDDRDRMFFCVGAEKFSMFVGSHGGTSHLKFIIYDARQRRHGAWGDRDAPNMIERGRWYHVAAVSGTDGMKLYFNGALVWDDSYPGSFAQMQKSEQNYLGNSTWAEDTFFRGQMTEVRVWNVTRTQAQIRENMFTNLTGAEANLVGLWNFNDGTAKDSSTNGRNGKFIGHARVVEAALPDASKLKPPFVLYCKVLDNSGNSVTNSTIHIFHQGEEVATTQARLDGTYCVTMPPEQTGERFDLQAIAGDLGAWAPGVANSGDERKEVNFILTNGVSIAGKVTAFDGSPIADVIVQAVRAGAPPWKAGSLATPGLAGTTLTTSTNASQSYRILNLPPGEYKLKFDMPEGQLEYHQGEIVRVEPGKTLQADVQIAPFRKGRWRRYSTANGLPSIRVRDLLFTPDGTLWLATFSGVSRFDGLKFTNISKRDGLMDDRVYCICRERTGLLWFGTEEGASRYDPATGRFQNFPSGTNGLTEGRVCDIAATPNGMVWLRTCGGLSSFDGQSFHAVPGIPAIPQSSGWSKSEALCVDHQGRVWTVTQYNDLWRVDGTNVVRFSTRDGLATQNQDALCVAPDGALWFQDEWRGYRRRDEVRRRAIRVPDRRKHGDGS